MMGLDDGIGEGVLGDSKDIVPRGNATSRDLRTSTSSSMNMKEGGEDRPLGVDESAPALGKASATPSAAWLTSIPHSVR